MNTRIRRALAPILAARCCVRSCARRSSSLCIFLKAGDGSGGSPSNSRSIFFSLTDQSLSTTYAPRGGKICLIFRTPQPQEGQREAPFPPLRVAQRMNSEETTRVRLDKWLWAARFFKTRGLAVDAIDSGKVEVNGERAKRAKQLQAGDSVRIRIGPYHHLVKVLALSERRGPASVAATLVQGRRRRAGRRAKRCSSR